MPRYYFDLNDGIPISDRVGTEFADDNAAKQHGRLLAEAETAVDSDGNAQLIHVMKDTGDLIDKIPAKK